ncbi:hypothetical protein STVIR_1385 [Streptomyces viridochromogenes Tue57]|uniref:Uncharacterized protein n=1 Tax=Streptomyces viridochromogenes Tue57 TaxID=1160705 RepID=L8PQI9_STRVR|nr:hypothetical protein STVIR_1385 [Streptomyces viridochromogenes Tue57]
MHNPDLVLATLNGKGKLEMELTVERGRGYVSAVLFGLARELNIDAEGIDMDSTRPPPPSTRDTTYLPPPGVPGEAVPPPEPTWIRASMPSCLWLPTGHHNSYSPSRRVTVSFAVSSASRTPVWVVGTPGPEMARACATSPAFSATNV